RLPDFARRRRSWAPGALLQWNRRNEVMKLHRLGAVLSLALCFCGVAATQDLKWESVKYRVVEDIVYGQKDGMGLTMDALIPETKPKNIGVIFIISGSGKSKKNETSEEEEKGRRQHWSQVLLNGGYTLF